MKINFIQKIIDDLRGKILYFNGLMSIYNIYKIFNGYSTLAIGSSHIAALYIPNEDGINMAGSSQDLYYSYELYKLINQKNKDLKNVILSFSVFSPGHCIIKTSENKLAVMYKLLFGIDYQYKEVADKENLYKYEKQYKKKIEEHLKKGGFSKTFRGGMPETYFDTTNINPEIARKRALKHLRNNKREDSQMPILKKLIEDTKNNNQNLFIVIPPSPSEYLAPLPDKKVLYDELYEMCDGYDHIKIVDWHDSELFEHSDFFDECHLNIKGAKKASKMIDDIIKEEKVNNG